MAFVRLLVCLDFSPLGDRVVAESIALARLAKASVVLVHVARTEPVLSSGGVGPPGGHRVQPADAEELRAKIDEQAQRFLEEDLEVRAELRLTDGAVHDAILEEIDTHEASYVVLGSHGHAEVFEILVGSVTRGVIRGARIPVIVVPDPRATVR